ncbi:MAG TPA: hypothetical protein PK178_12295 [Smithellaceae bacterium]|nr:hypothetical protein [Smithellaceae bacterium]
MTKKNCDTIWQAGIQMSSPRKRGTSSIITGFRIVLRLSGMT